MISFAIGVVVGAVVWTYREDLRLITMTLISRLWGKIFGDKNNTPT